MRQFSLKPSGTRAYSRLACSVIFSTSLLAAPHFAVSQPPAPPGAQPDINEEEYAKDSTTEINVKNADIAAIVRIFSKKTKRNFILDEKVRGKVSIYLPGKVSSEESLRILDSVLAIKGFTSVPIGENLWKIVPSKEARQTTIPTRTEASEEHPSSAVVTRLLQLKYVAAEDVQQILAQLVSPDGLINAYTGTNSLIIIDNEDNIVRLVRIVDELDVPFSNREMTIIPVKFADAADLADKLNEILGEGGKKNDPNADLARSRFTDPSQFLSPTGLGGAPGGAGVQPRPGGGSRTVSARGREPKIIPDERTNAIIVVADDETTARVRALVSQLDSKVDLSGGRFYVYRCQHANAEELAEVLSGIVGGSGGGSSSGGTGSSAFGSGSSSRSGSRSNSGFGSSSRGSSSSSSSRRNSRSGQGGGLFGDSGAGGDLGGGAFGGAGGGRGGAGGGSRGPTTTSLGDDITVTADPATNSLIIAAGKADYEKVKSLLERLDVKRRQVLVEAMLLEVSVAKNLRLDTDFLASTGGSDGGVLVKSEFGSSANSLTSLFSNPAQLQGFTVAAASAGSLKLPAGITIPTQSLLVSAAQSDENVNVLSAPTILATDNEEAQIVVGQNVPFLSSTSTSETNLNNTFNQIDREDVGITLRLTPQISSKDYVTLNVFTEVSALILATLNSSLGPTTRKRQSETTIIAKDGQMIVIGGLISDDVSESDEGVPFFKEIPVFGHLFRSNSQSHSQNNLLIFLTPRIVKDQFDIRDVTVEEREKLEDVIANYEVNPDRSDVLTNRRIDNVAEVTEYQGPKPGTIRAPSDYKKKKVAAAMPLNEDVVVLDGSKTNEDGVLELKVAPKLPEGSGDRSFRQMEDESSSDAVVEVDPSALGRMAPAEESRVEAPLTGERYFVLKMQGGLDNEVPLPFPPIGKEKLVGIVLPPDSSDSARQFFQVGRQYAYRVDSSEAGLELQGTFASKEEAVKMYPELAQSWYTLSPYEIIHLGKGPWITQ